MTRPNFLHVLLVLLCALPFTIDAAEKPDAEYQGFDGWWLQNEKAEAFVIAMPYPRIVAFRLRGGESPLHVSHEYEYFGVRTWFFEPKQIPESGLPALQPATAEKLSSRSLRLTGASEEKSGLQLTMEITLDDEKPLLHLRHGMKNLRPEARRIALWALNVIRPDHGVGVTHWRADEGLRSFHFWNSTDPDESSLHLGPKALAVDYRILPRNGWFKVGTNTDAGWVAYVWNGHALKSSVAFVSNAEYPEGGGTITFFNSTPEVFDGNPRFGEIENVGPLSDLLPGNSLWMEQDLEIISDIEGDDPEAWINRLSASRKE